MRAPGLGVIVAVARLLPESRREAWRQEWEGETAWAWQQLNATGTPTRWARLRLRLRVLTCVIDALIERVENTKMTGLGNDIRFALRGLLRKPGFTAVSVLTLGLGIGATTGVFTLLDGVLLKPLAFDRPEELVSLQHVARDGQDELPMSPGLYVLYRDRARTLAGLALYNPVVWNLVVDGEPERVPGQVVTTDFFPVLGARPSSGRTFLDEEGQPGAQQVVLLSEPLWRVRFGADPEIVGRTIDLNGVRREVVGVMPAAFGFPDREARFWVPQIVDAANAPTGNFSAGGIGRMAPGQSVESVRAELEEMLGRLPELLPGDGGAAFLMNVGIHARTAPLKQALVGDLTTTLWILFATVGIVLVIACANVANLLLVRAEGRQRELALRVALGAGRMGVLRSFMSESAALAVAGGALGLGLAALAVRTTVAFIPTDLPRTAEVGIDLRVLAFTGAIALGCALFFGFFPLLRYGAHDLAGQLREGGARGATGGRERHRLRNALVISQVSLALVLLIGSGLMLRSFVALRGIDPGFDPDGVLTARVTVPTAEIPEWQAADGFVRQLAERLAGLPGVTHVGYAGAVALGGSGLSYSGIEVEDHPRGPDELPVFANWMSTGPGYFETLRIPLVAGRTFTSADGATGFRAVVVGRSFAETWWPDGNALGRRLRIGGRTEDWYQIVGIVEDVRQSQIEQVATGMVYFPTVLNAGGQPTVARALDMVVRTTGDPLALVPALRREIRELNARIPVANPRAMADAVQAATARTSFTMAMLGTASGIALLLGLVGIYGVISYVVSQRTREIGVRMALGATNSTVRGMVVRQGLLLGGIGVGIGLIAALLLSRVMASLLYGVSATDPLTYLAVAVTLVGVAVLASLVPALRAAGVDPSRALRAE